MSATTQAPGVTPSQTVGPFFAPALLREPMNVLATAATVWLTPDWVKCSSSAARVKPPQAATVRKTWYFVTLMAHPLLLRLSKNPSDFSDKRFAACCAHNFAALRQNSTLAV